MSNTGTCPVCNGSGRMATPDHNRQYGEKYGWFGYSKEDDCCTCTNCGGQYQSLTPTGLVNQNKEGNPCTHSYTSETIGRCLTRYTCIHCDDQYTIDSGD